MSWLSSRTGRAHGRGCPLPGNSAQVSGGPWGALFPVTASSHEGKREVEELVPPWLTGSRESWQMQGLALRPWNCFGVWGAWWRTGEIAVHGWHRVRVGLGVGRRQTQVNPRRPVVSSWYRQLGETRTEKEGLPWLVFFKKVFYILENYNFEGDLLLNLFLTALLKILYH